MKYGMNKSYVKAAAASQHGITKLRNKMRSTPDQHQQGNVARDKSQSGPRGKTIKKISTLDVSILA
jgi:hypothetical protein